MSLKSNMTTPKDKPNTGYKIGAIIMLPMITVGLFVSNPKLAIITAKITIKKKLGLGYDFVKMTSVASFFSSFVILLNNCLIISILSSAQNLFYSIMVLKEINGAFLKKIY